MTSRAPRSAPASPRFGDGLALLAAAALAAAVFWNSLHYGLAQDAFAWIARTRGFFPHTTGIWRTLSYDAYYRVMDACFGLDGTPYRIVGLALHALNAALAMALALRLGLSRAAAFAATVFFAVHYANFDALFAVGSISEPMTTSWLLISLWLAVAGEGSGEAWRAALVTLAFVASLLSKETVVLYPLVLWLAIRWWPSRARGAVIACAAASAAFAVAYVLTDPIGTLHAAPGANPYEAHWDATMLSSWATYLSWAFHLVDLVQADLQDRVAPHLEGWWITAAWLGACASVMLRARRSASAAAAARVAALGLATYVAFIAPVLPLSRHGFHLYLYLPLIGLGWSLAAIWDAWVPRRFGALAWLVAAALVIQAWITVRGMEVVPLQRTTLPFMGSVRRALTVHKVFAGLAEASAPLPADLVMIGPDGASPPTRPDTTALGAFLFNDLSGALNEGSGIRLRFPAVRRVRFYGDLGPWIGEPDVVVFDYDGSVVRGPTALLDLHRAEVEWQAGRIGSAALALSAAEEMTRRWRALPAGPWRENGLDTIREQALAMIEEEKRTTRGADDRRVPRAGYLSAVARVGALTR